ncbi:hypothetical protein Goshw_000082 [Gossypium schwendimanii]|uniref:Uncharacterized protein n=1 Tax=Gossypium schwendimanii TaxID=34291 RepID=A0A7J9M944_GOSSC|nr:hypothetical protein [Gossypium schwendimanii]
MSRVHSRNRLIQTKLILHFQRRRKRVLRLRDQILLLRLSMLPCYWGII